MINGYLRGFAPALDLIHPGEDRLFSGVEIDSRRIKNGQLFVALRGERLDGHDFLAQAHAQGAAVALVEREEPAVPLPQWVVRDTRRALGDLAKAWRLRFELPVIGVTGSNGKTTVKQMLASICAQQGAVLATQGNLNNDIGVPLTLFNLAQDHRAAVIEMGANHAGEIAYLADLARPQVGLVNNAAAAHLEGFGSLDGVAKAKGELYQGLPAQGVAIINQDDGYAEFWKTLAGNRPILSFGFDARADFHADAEKLRIQEQEDHFETEFYMGTPAGEVKVRIPLPGRHNVANALAAAAAAYAAGIELKLICQGLAIMQPAPGRLQIRAGLAGVRLIDDTYNANPGSLAAALQVLTSLPGPHWLVLADMGELGPQGQDLHRQAGLLARQAGIDRLYSLGTLAQEAAQTYGAGAQAFEQPQQLAQALLIDIKAADHPVILFKGSRRMQLEQVVKPLLNLNTVGI
jgi:UDP-N-acetylmuramoyl-tripeptide--D-alanyl-D-alanine ligase